jgi:DNA-directed RNA polymerase subunit N (RpoN/RPB10)
MIIPVRCFTCGKVIAGKWKRYCELSAAQTEEENAGGGEKKKKTPYFDDNGKARILDELGLDKMCCRRHILTHVDLVDVI